MDILLFLKNSPDIVSYGFLLISFIFFIALYAYANKTNKPFIIDLGPIKLTLGGSPVTPPTNPQIGTGNLNFKCNRNDLIKTVMLIAEAHKDTLAENKKIEGNAVENITKQQFLKVKNAILDAYALKIKTKKSYITMSFAKEEKDYLKFNSILIDFLEKVLEVVIYPALEQNNFSSYSTEIEWKRYIDTKVDYIYSLGEEYFNIRYSVFEIVTGEELSELVGLLKDKITLETKILFDKAKLLRKEFNERLLNEKESYRDKIYTTCINNKCQIGQVCHEFGESEDPLI